jgi:hypothetical protein
MEEVERLTVVNVKKFPLALYRDFKSICAKKGWNILEGTIRAYRDLVEKEGGGNGSD